MSVSDHGSRKQIAITEMWSLSTLHTFILSKQNSALVLIRGSFFKKILVSSASSVQALKQRLRDACRSPRDKLAVIFSS